MRIKCFDLTSSCFTELFVYPHRRYVSKHSKIDTRAWHQLGSIADAMRTRNIAFNEVELFLMSNSLNEITRELNPAKKLRIEIFLDHDLITTSDDIGKAEVLDAELEDLVKKKVFRLLKNLFDEESKSPF